MAAFPEIVLPDGATWTGSTSGGTPFEYLFESYGEDFVVRGTNSFIKARVAWDESGDFLRDMLGSTTGLVGDPKYTRTLPQEHPAITDAWCVDAKLIGMPSSSKGGANQYDFGLDTGMFTTDWAVYGLTFSRMPYFVVDDATVSSQTIPELFRYCVIAERPRARERTINSYSLHVLGDATNFLKVPAFVMDREQDLVITQYQVPAGLYPFTAIDNCLGKVNEEAIELPISYEGGSSYVTRTYPAKTLLFRGVATDITVYPGPVGDSGTLRWYREIPLFFTYRPNTWTKLPAPTGNTYVEYVFNVTNDPLYSTQAFAAMFKPTT